MKLSLKDKVLSNLRGEQVGYSEDSDNLRDLVLRVCERFGWDYHTLRKQPIPFVLSLMDRMIQEAKKQKNKGDGKSSTPFLKEM